MNSSIPEIEFDKDIRDPIRFHEHTMESLRGQLAAYKVRCTALEEIIKNINMDGNDNTFYQQLLNILRQDEQYQRCQDELNDLRSDYGLLQKKYSILQDDYKLTLNMADEHLKDYDTLNQLCNTVLDQFIENGMQDLKEIRDRDSNFANLKLQTINDNLLKVFNQLRDHEASVMQDTKLENLFDFLQEQYDKFIKDVNDKLSVSLKLQDLIQDKFDKQQQIHLQQLELIKNNKEPLLTKLNKRTLSNTQNMLKNMESKILDGDSYSIGEKNSNNKINSSNNDTNTPNATCDLRSTEINKLDTLDKTNEISNYKKSLSKLELNINKLNDIRNQSSNIDINANQLLDDLSDSDESKLLPIIESSKIFNLNGNDENKLIKLEKMLLSLNEMLLEKESTDKLPIEQITEQINKFSLQNYNSLQDNIDNKLSKLVLPQDLIFQLTENLEDINLQLKENSMESNKQLELINSLKIDNQNLIQELQKEQLTTSNNELNLISFERTLSIHLKNIFHILQKILQQDSIDHSFKKLRLIDGSVGLKFLKYMEPKFESLLQFIESALESIINSYTKFIIATNTSPLSEISTQQQIDNQLRIDELQRRWQMEREKRKLDQKVAETRIDNLELHLKQLQNQISKRKHLASGTENV